MTRDRGIAPMAGRHHSNSTSSDGAQGSRKDIQLLSAWTQARNGDALAALFERNKNAVYRTAQFYTSQAAAEDIVQAVFLQLAQHKAQFKDKGCSVRAWLIRITINQCRLHLRTSIRRQKREDQVASLQPRSITASHQDSEVGEKLREAFEKLSPDYQQAILLRYMDGLSVKDAAFSMKLKTNTMEQRILRGLQKLRKSLAAAGVSATLAGLPKLLKALKLSDIPSSLSLPLDSIDSNPLQPIESTTQGKATLPWSTQLFTLGTGMLILSSVAFVISSSPENSRSEITPIRPDHQMERKVIESPSITRWNFSAPPPKNLYPIMGRWNWRKSIKNEPGTMAVSPGQTTLIPIPRTSRYPTFTIRVRIKRYTDNPIKFALKWFAGNKKLRHHLWLKETGDRINLGKLINLNEMVNLDFHFHQSYIFIKHGLEINCLTRIFEPLTTRHKPCLIMENISIEEIILMDNQDAPSAADLNTIRTWDQKMKYVKIPDAFIPIKKRLQPTQPADKRSP